LQRTPRGALASAKRGAASATSRSAAAKGREALRAAERAAQEARFAERASRDRLADLQQRIAGRRAARAARAQATKLEGDRGTVDLAPIDARMQEQLQIRQAARAGAGRRARPARRARPMRCAARRGRRMRDRAGCSRRAARIEEVRLKEQAALLQEQQYASSCRAWAPIRRRSPR
jgi:chromosome segregation protein